MDNQDQKEEILKKIYLFSKFSPSELSIIASHVRTKVFNARETIFQEGHVASSFFVVRYGTLKITTATKEGDDVGITTVAAGEHFGELPFISGAKRTATVEASEKTEVLEIDYSDLAKALSSKSEMELKFYKELSHYLVNRLYSLTNDLTNAREMRRRYT